MCEFSVIMVLFHNTECINKGNTHLVGNKELLLLVVVCLFHLDYIGLAYGTVT